MYNVLQYIYSSPCKAQTPERDIFPCTVFVWPAWKGTKKWGNGIISEIESTLARFSCQTLVTWQYPPITSHRTYAALPQFSCMTYSIVLTLPPLGPRTIPSATNFNSNSTEKKLITKLTRLTKNLIKDHSTGSCLNNMIFARLCMRNDRRGVQEIIAL